MKKKARRFGHPTRPETRLLLPPANDIHAGDDVLKSLVDSWLVPRLVDEFIREHGLDSTLRPVQQSQNDSAA